MIAAKQAVQLAKEQAQSMFGGNIFRLEEIERSDYKGRDVWRVTLGLQPDKSLAEAFSSLRQLALGPLEYKLFLIDADTGEFVAMKLREPTPQCVINFAHLQELSWGI